MRHHTNNTHLLCVTLCLVVLWQRYATSICSAYISATMNTATKGRIVAICICSNKFGGLAWLGSGEVPVEAND